MKYRTKAILKNTSSSILIVLIMIVCLFSIGGIIFNIVYIPAPVHSYSMYPTLNKYAPDSKAAGDIAYLNKFAEISKNDIVIAEVDWYSKAIIKRLIGTPGDTLEIRDEGEIYSLYVNEQLVTSNKKIDTSIPEGLAGGTIAYFQNYLDLLSTLPSENLSTTKQGNPCIKLNDNQYFLMGDNWSNSSDSIKYGPVSRDEILGKVDFVVYTNENKFFSILKQIVIATFKF